MSNNFEIVSYYPTPKRAKYPKDSPEYYKNKTIVSVKRLSDGMIFTIGDYVDKGVKIVEFSVREDKLFIQFGVSNEKHSYRWIPTDLDELIHYKKPSFVTDDNINIYEGDYGYIVKENNEISWGHYQKHHARYPRFKKLSSAESYVAEKHFERIWEKAREVDESGKFIYPNLKDFLLTTKFYNE